MTKISHNHSTVHAPQPRALPACESCRKFQPECVVPDEGEGAIELCWLCAHAFVDHACPLDASATHECDCLPEAIYPERVITARPGTATHTRA